MTQILLPDSSERRLTFHLAVEEYLASRSEASFFLWQTGPTVIFGRNQIMSEEVNVPFCRENGIDLVRRKSGGGCVYADRGNLFVSYIVPESGVEKVFSGYLERFAGVLRSLGADAVVTSHNDIIVGGRKVSGNAFFAVPGASIVHGTLLYNSDFSVMEQALRPPVEKLERHGVRSVRQRVGNLSEMVDVSLDAVREALAAGFCDSSRILASGELETVADLERTYLDEAFLLGKEKEKSYI